MLLDPYGGPHAQRVLQSRNSFLTSQWLADQGFAVLVVDGRGTPGRGPAWEKEVHHAALADVTLTDQVDALHAVAERYPHLLDLDRVAIRGWSYGGYLSALAVLRRPDVFHAALAGAPVTEVLKYRHRLHRALPRAPGRQPGRYERNSLIADAPSLRRPLLLMHGLGDDDVFVAHSLRLSAALLAAGRDHTFLPLVGVTHMTPQSEEVAENLMLMQVRWLKQQLGMEASDEGPCPERTRSFVVEGQQASAGLRGHSRPPPRPGRCAARLGRRHQVILVGGHDDLLVTVVAGQPQRGVAEWRARRSVAIPVRRASVSGKRPAPRPRTRPR